MAGKRRSLTGGSHASRYAAIREYKGVELSWRALDSMGAHSVGIGRKLSEGGETNTLSLRFYVARKRAESRLSAREKIPKALAFFSRKRGNEVRVTTDVIETPPAQLEQVDPERRVRPVPGGVSIGIPSTSGTLGGWAWDETDGTLVFLSNEHVLGTAPGVDVVQQSVTDGGALPADKIGVVKRGIPRSADVPNRVDCAIGDPSAADLCDFDVLEVGPAVYAVDAAVLDLAVEKFGQTTRHTFGEITDADWSGQVSGRPFEDCFRIDVVAPSGDWSSGGDSGSLVFSRTPISEDSEVKPVVGLHFGGASTHGIGCKIQNVFSALDLTTLCAGAFAAFLDALFEAETEGAVTPEAEARLRSLSAMAAGGSFAAPPPFVRSEREAAGAGRFFAGISRDLQQRLAGSGRGRTVTDFVDRHRAELLTLLTHEGDVRRATVAALRPLVAGATTTTDVLERVLTDQDLAALDKLAREVEGRATARLKLSLGMLRALRDQAAGRSLADILGLDL